MSFASIAITSIAIAVVQAETPPAIPALNSLADQPGEIIGAACLIDRSGGKVDLGTPLVALCEFAVPDYDPRELPPELAALPPTKPGSRGIQGAGNPAGKGA